MCEITQNVKTIINDKFDSNEKLMDEKFKNIHDLIKIHNEHSEKLMTEKFRNFDISMGGKFSELKNDLSYFTTNDKKIDCLKEKMVTKKFAYGSIMIFLGVISIFIALIGTNVIPI